MVVVGEKVDWLPGNKEKVNVHFPEFDKGINIAIKSSVLFYEMKRQLDK